MKWVKPNGTKIETNDTAEVLAYAKSLGWVEDSDAPKDISDMTVKELTAALEEAGIDIPEGSKKADLVALLEGEGSEG
jgi:hypothetical protein